jgi:hypothetical protein
MPDRFSQLPEDIKESILDISHPFRTKSNLGYAGYNKNKPQ